MMKIYSAGKMNPTVIIPDKTIKAQKETEIEVSNLKQIPLA